MTNAKPPRGFGNRKTLTPPRTYQVPGGPATRNLGETDIKILAPVERGGDEDLNAGR